MLRTSESDQDEGMCQFNREDANTQHRRGRRHRPARHILRIKIEIENECLYGSFIRFSFAG